MYIYAFILEYRCPPPLLLLRHRKVHPLQTRIEAISFKILIFRFLPSSSGNIWIFGIRWIFKNKQLQIFLKRGGLFLEDILGRIRLSFPLRKRTQRPLRCLDLPRHRCIIGTPSSSVLLIMMLSLAWINKAWTGGEMPR